MLIEGMNKEKHNVPLLYPEATFCKGISDFWQGFREGFMACASNTLSEHQRNFAQHLSKKCRGGAPYTESLVLLLPGGKGGK